MTALGDTWHWLVADLRASWEPGMAWVMDTGERGRLGVAPVLLLAGGVPDWDDDATRGVLLGQCRRRSGNPYLTTCCVLYSGVPEWEVEGPGCHDGTAGETYASEAEALLAVLSGIRRGLRIV